jgi:predicted O-methyltransferase YrrM
LHATSRWTTFYLSHLVKPASDRLIYKAILRNKIARIVELGIGDGSRAIHMIDAAAHLTDRNEVYYIGIDPFEGRVESDSPGLPLIEAHRVLKQTGAKIKLVPGDPIEGLIRSANAMTNIDLLLISASQNAEQLDRLWFFIPRMLHDHSLLLLEKIEPNGTKSISSLDKKEILQRASFQNRRKAA